MVPGDEIEKREQPQIEENKGADEEVDAKTQNEEEPKINKLREGAGGSALSNYNIPDISVPQLRGVEGPAQESIVDLGKSLVFGGGDEEEEEEEENGDDDLVMYIIKKVLKMLWACICKLF